ncbi:MAG: alanine racemase [Coraliomargaritaceae bacterium]
MNQRCWAEIDLAAFERNVRCIQTALPKGVHYISVVKADAYGLGMPQIVRRLMQCGVDYFAVANVAEASEIRQMGVGWPILVLGPVLPHEMECLIADDLIATVSHVDEVNCLDALGRKRGVPVQVHVKIDTGMGRLGVWHEQAQDFIRMIDSLSGLRLAGVYTHFSSADTDPAYTTVQRNRFTAVLKAVGKRDWLVHADNSASLETFGGAGFFNAVRMGLLQYGVPPYPDSALGSVSIEPMIGFYTRVGLIKELPKGASISYGCTRVLERDSTIGILTAGYGDGVPLGLSNRGEILIRGRRCPILGRVTMDQTVVDLSDCKNAQLGDRATLIGNDGQEAIPVSEFSKQAGSIPWESLSTLTKRVTRTYQGLREV